MHTHLDISSIRDRVSGCWVLKGIARDLGESISWCSQSSALCKSHWVPSRHLLRSLWQTAPVLLPRTKPFLNCSRPRHARPPAAWIQNLSPWVPLRDQKHSPESRCMLFPLVLKDPSHVQWTAAASASPCLLCRGAGRLSPGADWRPPCQSR